MKNLMRVLKIKYQIVTPPRAFDLEKKKKRIRTLSILPITRNIKFHPQTQLSALAYPSVRLKNHQTRVEETR